MTSPIIALQFENYQLYFGLALTGFFMGLGSKTAEYISHKFFNHTENKIKKIFTKK
jgi:hypothetical protein